MSKIKRTIAKQQTAKSIDARQNNKPVPDTNSQPISKHDQILSLLRRKQGSSLDEIQKVSGWQQHSVRGFLSGTVKKRLGLKLQSSKRKNGERRYAIAV